MINGKLVYLDQHTCIGRLETTTGAVVSFRTHAPVISQMSRYFGQRLQIQVSPSGELLYWKIPVG